MQVQVSERMGQGGNLILPFSSKTPRIWAWSPEEHRKMELAYLHGDKQAKRQAAQRFNAMMGSFSNIIARAGADRLGLSSYGSFPSLINQAIPAGVTFDASTRETIDTRWTVLYRMLDRRQSNSPLFSVQNTYTNLTFNEYNLNEPIDADYIEGDLDYYQMKVYAALYYYNRMWSQWTEMWDENEGLAMMGIRWAFNMAKIAYETIADNTGSVLTSVSYDSTGATVLEKDINTINNGISTIQSQLYSATTDNSNQIYEDVSQGSYALLYNSNTSGYEARVAKALQARLDLPNDNQSIGYVMRPVIPIGSPHVVTGTWKLTLLGRRNVFAMGRDLVVDSEVDLQKAGTGVATVGQGAFRAVRDDVKQVVSLALS